MRTDLRKYRFVNMLLVDAAYRTESFKNHLDRGQPYFLVDVSCTPNHHLRFPAKKIPNLSAARHNTEQWASERGCVPDQVRVWLVSTKGEWRII